MSQNLVISSERINSQIQTTPEGTENGVAVSGVSVACFRCVSLEAVRLETKFNDYQAYSTVNVCIQRVCEFIFYFLQVYSCKVATNI